MDHLQQDSQEYRDVFEGAIEQILWPSSFQEAKRCGRDQEMGKGGHSSLRELQRE
jgi:hypothetical protein